MRKIISTIYVSLLLIFVSFTSCRENKTTSEKIEDTATEVKAEVEDNVEDAADEVGDAVEDAADEVEDSMD